MGVGTRHQLHSARSCELALRPVGAARGRPGGGVTCLDVGRLVSGAHPRPTARPWGVRPGPATQWLWVREVFAWGPVTNSTVRALASWLCALWGRPEGARGGASLASVWGVQDLALNHARPPVLGACGRGPLPTGGWCGGCGRGDPLPTPGSALLRAGLAPCGGGTGAPGGGGLLPGCGASGVGRSRSPDRPSPGRAAGVRYPLAVGAGDVGVATRHLPHSALLQTGFARLGSGTRAPGGRCLLPGCGASWAGRSPTHDRRFLRGVRPRPATYWLWVGGLWAWGPVTNPTACALASWLCALGAARGRAGGGVPSLGVGRPGLGALPRPTAHPWGAAGARYPLAVGAGRVGVGTRHPLHSARSCELALRAVGAARRRPGGGGGLLPGCGASGVGRSPTTDRPSLGRAAGSRYPQAVGVGGVGGGTRHQPHSARSCELAFCAVGAARVHPGGGALAWVSGICDSAPSRARPPVLGACGRGLLPTCYGCGLRAWGPSCLRHPLPCRGSSCVVCASRLCGTWWPLLLGTCLCAVPVACGVPLWRASWPRVGAPHLVRLGHSRCSCRRGAFPQPGVCRPRLYLAAARGTWRPAGNQAHCACRWRLLRQGCWPRSTSYSFGAPR